MIGRHGIDPSISTEQEDAQNEDAAGFAALVDFIVAESGFRCHSYKERCLRRRIAVRMRARGAHSFAGYARLLDGDEGEWERLMDALTINVTKLFRNAEAYESLARNIIPDLWQSDASELRIWSAGCSSGEEPYSVATLFVAHAAAIGQSERNDRISVLGTDIDRESLRVAEIGQYPESAFADTPPALRERYFSAGFPARVDPEVRARVRFQKHDLLNQAPPSESFHLIVCRNVLIYFDRESQERLFALFRDHLVPGGALFLGKVETLLGDSRRGFMAVDARERMFRRL